VSLLSPLLITLFTALVTGMLSHRKRSSISLAGAGLLMVASIWLFWVVSTQGTQSLALGAWPIPYAIEFKADGLSAILIVLVALINLLVLLYQAGWPETDDIPGLLPLQHALIAATIATLLAADLFNLYVWFELMLISTLGLLVLGGAKRHFEAAFKYFALSMLGTLLMLAAIGLIQGATGHLNLSALAEIADDPSVSDTLLPFIGLLFISVFLKAGVFPLYAWLPAAYHTLPAPILALVGGLLTKISVYVLLRLNGQVFETVELVDALGWLAMLTMISGVLGAAFHWDLRRILAFHIVSQIGYLLLGLALASPASAAATSFFLLHNILVKTNLILIAGLMWMAMGHYDLRRGGGLYPAQPFLAALFLVNALALVGVPPSTGFWGKLLILQEAFSQERYIWAAIALATGLLTLYSMSKIWLEGYWKPADSQTQAVPLPSMAVSAVSLLTLVILIIGLYPEPLIEYLNRQSLEFWR
jgi:multicomponent Na+:H+ antiporter subunit D